MTLAEFKRTFGSKEPPAAAAAPLQALWFAAKGEWDRAHALVQDDDGIDAAWVHAYLHRVEGDLPNAGYWYRRAGRTAPTGTFESEWEELAAGLLDRTAA
ncbi:MAG TPA: hypothetical protein VHG27_07700 [Xanthobacteraceae bacterium]|nr:hypothetical protein [Xanthobacteraceae bacterium]